MNTPPKVRTHAQTGYRLVIIALVLSMIAQIWNQYWIAAIASASAIVGWALAAQLQKALTVSIGTTDALLNTVEEGHTVAIVRTTHPQQFLLINERQGTRWRISDHGMWTREDW